MPQVIGDYIDRLVNTEMRVGSGSLPRGVTYPLYEAARKKQGEPLTYLAAKKLIDTVKKGDTVIVATGAGTAPGLPKGETDGPLGAAAIARAIDIGLGGKPVFIGEERNMPSTRACALAAGLMIDEELFPQRPNTALALDYPLGPEEGARYAEKLLETYTPKAVITVEKAGASRSGRTHSITGFGRLPDLMANVWLLTDMALAKGIPVISVGDGGNEIGYGIIEDDVRRIQPWGDKCDCPCGTGIATVSKCDVLISAAVSNWGAYGIAAMLAFMLKNPNVLHDTLTEKRMLIASIEAGAMDGSYTALVPYVDGISLDVQMALITMLHEIVGNGLKSHTRIF